jgi:hypothetical protein
MKKTTPQPSTTNIELMARLTTRNSTLWIQQMRGGAQAGLELELDLDSGSTRTWILTRTAWTATVPITIECDGGSHSNK